MKKVYKIEDLDCANCANKIENAIKKIDGVQNASVSFIMGKVTVECDEENLDSIMKQAIKAAKKIEPDCRIVL